MHVILFHIYNYIAHTCSALLIVIDNINTVFKTGLYEKNRTQVITLQHDA